MAVIASNIPLKQIIFEYIDQSMKDRSAYRRLYPIAIRGVMELGVDVFMEPKTCKLNVLPNKTCKLPPDYVTYVSVGVLNENGEVATLKYNKNLTTYYDDRLSRAANNTDKTITDLQDIFYQFFLQYYFVYPYESLFGIPSGSDQLGSFNIDNNRNIILLDNDFQYSYIMLTYLGINIEDDIYVPYFAREALIAWLSWKDIETVPVSGRSSLAEKNMRRMEYYNQKRIARMRASKINLSSLYDVSRSGIRLTVKI